MTKAHYQFAGESKRFVVVFGAISDKNNINFYIPLELVFFMCPFGDGDHLYA